MDNAENILEVFRLVSEDHMRKNDLFTPNDEHGSTDNSMLIAICYHAQSY